MPAVQYSGAGGRDPYSSDDFIPFIEKISPTKGEDSNFKN